MDVNMRACKKWTLERVAQLMTDSLWEVLISVPGA